MIALLLDGMDFEQDIRELCMAFFPGVEYTYNTDVIADLTFRAKVNGDEIVGSIRTTKRFVMSKEMDLCEQAENDLNADLIRDFCVRMFKDRITTKNALKRAVYLSLQSLTGRMLPWGTLTGIRPTKLAMEKLEQGLSPEDVQDFMQREYLLSTDKAKLCVETAFAEKEILTKIDYEQGWSLYIGIPFCPTRCAYCSFTGYPISVWEKQGNVKAYIDALCMEIEAVANWMQNRVLQTIYMGGGTPTSISADQLDRILCLIKEKFDLQNLLEFTIEAGRPDSITREKLEVIYSHGVKRISINPQTMKQETLDIIGRYHRIEDVLTTYQLAREVGFENINMDIIMGLPDESLDDVKHTMQVLSTLKPESITVHSLAIKRAARLRTDREEFLDKKIENTWEMLSVAADTCKKLGLKPYYLYRQKNMAGNFENVGYSMVGKECLYNILIMEEKQTILACGAGTSSKIIFPKENRLERVETVKDPKLYVERIEEMISRKEDKISEWLGTSR